MPNGICCRKAESGIIPSQGSDMAREIRYTSFLVRLWGEANARHQCVAEVESIPSGQRDFFPCLEDLFAFIRRQAPSRHEEDQLDRVSGD
jgi:hypothetical protein